MEPLAAGPYMIEARDTGMLLGSTGLLFETPSRAATGYVLAADAWGQGFATEALGAMLEVAREVGSPASMRCATSTTTRRRTSSTSPASPAKASCAATPTFQT